LTRQLKQLSQAEDVTLFMTLLAAFNTLLYRLSQQVDITIGTPIVTHHHHEAEDLLGCFVNTLVLRTDLSGAPSFRTLLQRVRATALDAYLHQDMPFERLVEVMHIERGLSHHPLFQVMFVLSHPKRFELSGLSYEHLDLDLGRSRFDMLFGLEDGPTGLSGTMEYSTDLFEATTIERLVQQFETLLGSIVAEPDRHIGELTLLTRAERKRMVVEWNATQADYAGKRCVHQLFEEQVKRTPQSIAAVDCAGQHLTYDALNRRANQLAHQLAVLKLRVGETVAVFMERSLEVLPALLGILKAGGAYVPLEPSLPPTRLQWIISSLDIRVIVTRHTQLQAIRASCETLSRLTQVICLDQPEQNILAQAAMGMLMTDKRQVWTAADLACQPETDRPPQSCSDDLAYIIFTSGSTGIPKGVMVQHRPLINLIEWISRVWALGPSDRVLFVTSLCFDLSVFDIFGLLAVGGSIRIAADHELRNPQRLVQLLYDEPISFWDSAPAMLQQLVPFFPSGLQLGGYTDRLRLVFLSGDWIPVTLPDQVRSAFPSAHVISLGGATEAVVWSNYYPIVRIDPYWISIPYGRPIHNAQYYILDAYLEPCPVHVPGDLYIGGDCLALGYVNDPHLTADKFIPDPFSGDQGTPGARLYRTGDQARFWPDGTIEFLGRIDSQVKVRGFRIELGEIEAVLLQYPAVRQAIVVAQGSGAAERRLVAYLVFDAQVEPVAIADIRTFLRKRLPEYMIPALLLVLDRLPSTANGKVDRKALPVPESLTVNARSELESAYTPPQTSIECTISTLWQEALGVGHIDIYDNIFDLGGHSLLLVQVHRRLCEQFLLDLPITELFNHTTVATLASYIKEALDQRATVESTVQPVPLASEAEVEQRARQDADRDRLNQRRRQRQQDKDR
jgi:amino acid adenylation domain-containing protein